MLDNPKWTRRILWLALAAMLACVGLAAADERGNGSEDDPLVFRVKIDDGAYLGVSTREETELEQGGARVTSVVDGSPAAEAGIREGDVIVKVDGDVIRGPLRLRQAIRQHEPGDGVRIHIVRDGKMQTLEAELGDREDLFDWFGGFEMDQEWLQDLTQRSRELAERAQEEHVEQYRELAERWNEEYADRYRELAERYSEWGQQWAERYHELQPNLRFSWSNRPRLGVELIDTTEELRLHLGGPADAGVLVSRVLADTPAERAGIQVGDLILSVDGEAVRGSSDLIRELADAAGKTIEIEVVRNGRNVRIRAEIPQSDDEEAGFGPRAELDARREVERTVRRELRQEMQRARELQQDALREQREVEREVRRELRKARIEAHRVI